MSLGYLVAVTSGLARAKQLVQEGKDIALCDEGGSPFVVCRTSEVAYRCKDFLEFRGVSSEFAEGEKTILRILPLDVGKINSMLVQ